MTDVNISPAERRLILWALAVVLLLSALDQTIVSTAMPRIIEQLHGMNMYAWVTTAYLLDLDGRRCPFTASSAISMAANPS